MNKVEKYVCECHNKGFKSRHALTSHLDYFKRKKVISGYHKDHYIIHREKILKNQEIYRATHISALRRNLQSWEGFLPSEAKCSVCGVVIHFNKRNKVESIHFDHKEESKHTPKYPMNWLATHPRTSEKEKIWLSFDFGILCIRCNGFLPAKNRKNFIINVYKYVFGKEPK